MTRRQVGAKPYVVSMRFSFGRSLMGNVSATYGIKNSMRKNNRVIIKRADSFDEFYSLGKGLIPEFNEAYKKFNEKRGIETGWKKLNEKKDLNKI